MDNWKRKELWHQRGEGFCVEVSHHTTPTYDSERLTTHASEGENRWCVYAYIYPEHPHFAKFEGDKMWQDAALALPLHGGPSMLRWHRDANCNATSVQVGADYNHDGDGCYTHYDDAAEARSVFRDADELAAWLATPNAKVTGSPALSASPCGLPG
jgi:hypothetical protein